MVSGSRHAKTNFHQVRSSIDEMDRSTVQKKKSKNLSRFSDFIEYSLDVFLNIHSGMYIQEDSQDDDLDSRYPDEPRISRYLGKLELLYRERTVFKGRTLKSLNKQSKVRQVFQQQPKYSSTSKKFRLLYLVKDSVNRQLVAFNQAKHGGQVSGLATRNLALLCHPLSLNS